VTNTQNCHILPPYILLHIHHNPHLTTFAVCKCTCLYASTEWDADWRIMSWEKCRRKRYWYN